MPRGVMAIMEVINPGIVFKTECIYEKEIVDGKKIDVYKGFKNEGVAVVSNIPRLKKGSRVLVNPWGGSEIPSLSTKKHRFLVIEERDILLKL